MYRGRKSVLHLSFVIVANGFVKTSTDGSNCIQLQLYSLVVVTFPPSPLLLCEPISTLLVLYSQEISIDGSPTAMRFFQNFNSRNMVSISRISRKSRNTLTGVVLISRRC